MFNKKGIFVIGLVLILITLSACGPDTSINISDPAGDDAGPEGDVDPPEGYNPAEEGTATVYYHYHMDHPDLEFKIDPIIPVHFGSGTEPGSHIVSGIGGTNVHFRMAGGTAANRCNVHCDVVLRFVAEGEIQLDPNTGACTIPMNFVFTPQADEWIMETDCPPEAEAVIDCAALSLVMADPGVYTFTKTKRDVPLSSGQGATRQAEMKELNMPDELEGLCNW